MRCDALRLVLGLTLPVTAILAPGCGGETPPYPPASPPSSSSPTPPPTSVVDAGSGSPATIVLDDVTLAAGIDFLHDAAETAERAYPEIIGAGAAVLDCDGDGDLDLYLVQGGRIPGFDSGTDRPNRLLRNAGGAVFPGVPGTARGAGPRGLLCYVLFLSEILYKDTRL